MGDTEPNGTPAASDPAGQRPTSDPTNSNTNANGGNGGQQPSGQSGQQPGNDDGQQPGAGDDNVRDPVAKARAEAEAKYRTQLRAAERERDALRAEKQALADKDLSEKERAEKRAADAEAALATERAANRQRIVRAEVRVQAASVGIKPELAARLIDTSEIPAEADDDEMAAAIAKLLKQLAKENPELVRTQPNAGSGGNAGNANGGQPSGQPSGTPNPGATAPERQNGPITVTANQYLDAAFGKEFKTRYGLSVQDAVLQRKAQVIG